MKNLITVLIFSIPFIIMGWYLLSKISFGVYRIVDRSYTSFKTHVPLFVIEYLSPVGWQETIAGSVPGDGWTYTVEWPHCFDSAEQAMAFCKNTKKSLTPTQCNDHHNHI